MTALATDTSDVRYIAPDDLPWVDPGNGAKLRLVRVDLSIGEWVLQSIFSPGFMAPRHRHTGAIDAYTVSGRWRYVEYGIDYVAGSYIHEPTNSIHQLCVPEDNTTDTEVIFVMRGANLNLDEHDNVVSVTDASTMLAQYERLCAAAGYDFPEVLR